MSAARRLFALPVAALIAVLAATTAIAAPARASEPPTPHEKAPIEGFAAYQPQFFCRSTVEPGVKAFEAMLLRAYPMTGSDGDLRSCAVAGTSEHKDGRAFDWGADHRVPAQRRAGQAVLRWLFAADSYGNSDAMFRRLGLMYIIWNKRIWGAWSQRWEPYACSGPTLCHVNHMHFSFGWAGAEKKTSYWTHRVSPTVEPPLPVLGRAGAHRSLTVSARSGEVTAHWLLKGGATYRVTATGVWHHGAGRHALSDAVCARTSKGWTPAGGVRIDGDQLSGWGETWTPTRDAGNGCNPATHRYRMVLTPAAGSTVQASLPDDGRGDGSGSVRLRITRTG